MKTQIATGFLPFEIGDIVQHPKFGMAIIDEIVFTQRVKANEAKFTVDLKLDTPILNGICTTITEVDPKEITLITKNKDRNDTNSTTPTGPTCH